jgi:hypothetical protein
MNKAGQEPITYDFFSKSLKDAAVNRRQQSDSNNFKGIPAEVVGVEDYESLQCISVKALINDVFVEKDNTTLESITLKKVFVALPRSGGFTIKMPVAVGDIVRLCWSHRDLGEFLDGEGSSVDINVNEIAGIEDCWAELGFGTRKNHSKPSVSDWIIEGPKTKITITPTGSVSIETEGESSIKSAKHTVDTSVKVEGVLNVSVGESGVFTSGDGKMVTVQDGIITEIL